LAENPVYQDHEIILHAFCSNCLVELNKSCEAVIAQQYEYDKLKLFFEKNKEEYTWCPVPQDGRCCLNGIYEACDEDVKGQLGSLEKFIIACANGAIEELKSSEVELPKNKKPFATLFKKLARQPQDLAQLWTQLEVQYLWLGLTNCVLPNVRLKLYELNGKSEMKCMQSFPEEGERERTIHILQWNRGVAAHYDLMRVNVVEAGKEQEDEVVDDESKKGGKAEGNNKKVRKSRKKVAKKKGTEGVKKLDDEKEMAEDEKEKEGEEEKRWEKGKRLEAEMMDPEFPQYLDTMHPVEVMEYLEDTNQYRCKLLAFANPDVVDVWEANMLHELREQDLGLVFKKNDPVHVRIRNRSVTKKGKDKKRNRKEEIDGLVANDGIWMKARIVRKMKEEYEVEHRDWSMLNETAKRVVKNEDVRELY
jgi:hypothetical protein